MKSLTKLFAGAAVLVMALTVLSGCNLFKSEQQKFVSATIEATCYIFQQDNIMDPAVEQAAKDIYGKYGFNTTDDAAMKALSEKYSQDSKVTDEIMAGIQKCNPGLFGGEGAPTGTGAEVVPPAESGAVVPPTDEVPAK